MISVILMMTPVPHQTSFLTRANRIALTMILMILMTIRGNVKYYKWSLKHVQLVYIDDICVTE